MTIHDHLQELHGLPAFGFPSSDGPDDLPSAGSVAWRLSADPYDDETEDSFQQCWRRFAEAVDLSGIRALIIGPWGEGYDNSSAEAVELLTGAKDELTALEALFLGDMVVEESEISWIQQSDVTPLLDAFPRLLSFGVRGGSDLLFPAVRHEALRTLRIETGGLPRAVVQGVGASELPALEDLILWLGDPNYGGDAEVFDLAPLLAGGRFPALRHLGLQNSVFQDEIAAAVAQAPVVAGLESLGLGMGVLTDEGAAALLAGQPLTHLKRLDLHHHFLTDPMMRRVRDTLEPAGVEVDLSEQEEADVYAGEAYRYVAVSE